MFKKSKGLRKQVTGRLLSFLLALTVAIVPFSTSFPSIAQANTVSAITLQSAVIGNGNQDVTLTFNVPVAAGNVDWQSMIELKGTFDGAFNSINNYEDYANISDTGAVIVHFNSALVGANNQIRIKAGALVGDLNHSGYALTSDLVTDSIAAQDVTAPNLVSTAISSDLKNVTLTLNTTVQTATYTVSSVTYNVYLYDFVKIKTMYDPSDFIPLSSDDQISVKGNQIVIAFASPLSGYKEIQVLNGAVKGANGIVNQEMYAELNTNPIAYSNYNLNNNSELDLYFSQGVVNNSLSDDALKAAVTISKDNGAFTALGVNDTAALSNNSSSDLIFSLISIGNGSLHLHFFTPLAPGSYKVKIAANALKSRIGLATGELTTDTISVSDITAPNYQKAEVSTDRKAVTLTFDKKLYDNTVFSGCNYQWDPIMGWQYVCGDPVSHLKDYVNIKRSDSGSYRSLSSGDTVVLSDNKLIVNLQTALSGANNKIAVKSYALKSESGHIQYSGVVTRPIDVSTTAPPKYLNSAIDNLNQDWTLFFDKNVKSNTASLDDLKAAIKLSIGGFEKSLDSNTTVTFADNKMVLHFSAPLVDNNIEVHIAANAIADTLNNVLADPITTEALTPNDFYPPQFSYADLITTHSVELRFNTSLVDNTTNTTGSLKATVTYSTDKGATFSSLQPDDAVTVNGSYLVVYFHNVIQGNLQIKVAGNALKDTSGNILTTSVVTGDIDTNYVPSLIGSFFSNAPSVLTFEDNATWRSKIQKVVQRECGNYNIWNNRCYRWSERILSPDEYTISAGKLVIHQGVLEQQVNYQVIVYADGFDDKYSDSMNAIQTQDSYYITPVTIDTTSGITAKVKIAKNQSYGHLNVIFQLMNDQTPVSIVAAESNFAAGTFTANFNVADAATNPKYTVRAFVVSEYSNSPSTVGVNLATQITDAKYDLLNTFQSIPFPSFGK